MSFVPVVKARLIVHVRFALPTRITVTNNGVEETPFTITQTVWRRTIYVDPQHYFFGVYALDLSESTLAGVVSIAVFPSIDKRAVASRTGPHAGAMSYIGDYWHDIQVKGRSEDVNSRKLALLAGILVAGASPSFIDWEQSPEYRKQVYIWYGIAVALVVFGLWDGA